MAVVEKTLLLERLKEKFGDDTTDETLSLYEDVSDTLDAYSKDEETDWKRKYQENDENWRKKYRDRFFKAKNEKEEEEEEEEAEREKYSYEKLFREEN